jgi:transposase
MIKICKSVFPNARLVIDRFHVMKEVLSDMQTIRKRTQIKRKNKENEMILHAKES